MRRLLTVAAATLAMVAVPTAADANHYDRTCGGVLDYECVGTVCSLDCFTRDCFLWVDPLHNPHLAQCTRPIVVSQ